MEKSIIEAIKTTLVVENPESIESYTVPKIIKIIEQEKRKAAMEQREACADKISTEREDLLISIDEVPTLSTWRQLRNAVLSTPLVTESPEGSQNTE